ncbi:CCGSCS motif protein [Vibrio sp. 10N.261.51.F12]|uniref:CCGSCS motif protein n=1 Tax=Vibrio sp. 10N.261.51.F12 TaxID=3229679 RepID=UPI0035527BAB
MTLSIKKIFQNKETKSTESKQVTSSKESKENNSIEKKIKHDTPTGCCGSCS